ncbi:MAG TPA: radical SAM protein [Myxococcota bacterium]|nr:radical SAM protein [Myxococcota bacterium]
MRVAFVSGNREKLPDAVIPLGLLYVMAATPERHERALIDLCFELEPEAALKRALVELAPDVIALGLRNIQNNDYSGIRDNVAYYAGLVRAMREVTRAPIVLGGSGFSVMPAELLARLGADFGIAGEAEGSFPQLLDALEAGGAAVEGVPGLHRATPAGVVSNRAAPGFLDLNALARPDRSLVDPRYYERYAIDSLQTKRGCPLRCDYCTYPLIEGRIGRTRAPAAVADELEHALVQQPGMRHFFIVDSVFNLPRRHAKDVCRELGSRALALPWTCYANPLGFDAELAKLAQRAGCAGMEIGSDSGRDDVLARLRKGFTTAEIRQIHVLCSEAGIPDCHTFILGTPGESLDDVKRTLAFVSELDPFSAILMIWIDDAEALAPALRRERAALRERIAELLLEGCRSHPHWIVPPLGVNFDARLFRRVRRAGLHGPLWQHLRGSARSLEGSLD